jgi:hypothetical protein
MLSLEKIVSELQVKSVKELVGGKKTKTNTNTNGGTNTKTHRRTHGKNHQ